MKKIILFLCLVQAIMDSALGQQFTYQSNTPFGIQPVLPDNIRPASSIFFFDHDGDGDFDLFLTGLDSIDPVSPLEWINLHFFIQMQENTGSRFSPQFGPRQDVSASFPYPVGYFFAAPGDLNQDGQMDLITSATINQIGGEKLTMLMNTGMPGPGQFQATTMDVFGLDDYVPESLYVPSLVDLDGDGDLDLMTSGFNSAFAEEDGPDIPTFYYARNTGTKNVPVFEGWYSNPYQLSPHPSAEILTAGDIDNDGDEDLLGSLFNIPADSMTHLYVHLNTPGGNGKPAFPTAQASPYGLPSSSGEEQLMFPSLVDLDGDGDLDLFVFRGSGQVVTLEYYSNNLCQPTTQELPLTLCEGESVFIGGVEYNQEGEYFIHLESIQHCDSLVHLTLEILPAVTVNVEATICEGDSYQVGNETFSLPGNYMVLVTSANGCDSIVFLTLTVNVVDVSLTSADHLLTANQAGATYQWLDCDSGQNIPGATGQTYVVTITGNYAVRITDGLGCTAVSACIHVTITGLKEELISNGISLYPNPANGIVFIKNQTSFPITKLTVMDVSGKVNGEFFPDRKNSIDLSAVGTGVYFIKIEFNGKEAIKRIIVQ